MGGGGRAEGGGRGRAGGLPAPGRGPRARAVHGARAVRGARQAMRHACFSSAAQGALALGCMRARTGRLPPADAPPWQS